MDIDEFVKLPVRELIEIGTRPEAWKAFPMTQEAELIRLFDKLGDAHLEYVAGCYQATKRPIPEALALKFLRSDSASVRQCFLNSLYKRLDLPTSVIDEVRRIESSANASTIERGLARQVTEHTPEGA